MKKIVLLCLVALMGTGVCAAQKKQGAAMCTPSGDQSPPRQCVQQACAAAAPRVTHSHVTEA